MSMVSVFMAFLKIGGVASIMAKKMSLDFAFGCWLCLLNAWHPTQVAALDQTA